MDSVTFDPSRIRELLAHQGRTSLWLANATEYNHSHVSRMLNGRLAISEAFAARASKALDVPVHWFYTDQREQVPA